MQDLSVQCVACGESSAGITGCVLRAYVTRRSTAIDVGSHHSPRSDWQLLFPVPL